MRWKVIGLALLIFATGVISGVMGQRLLTARPPVAEPPARPFPGGPPMPWASQRMDFLQRLTVEIELTPEQTEQIDTIIQTSQQRMRDLWDPVAPKAQEEMTRSREAIAALLTPGQQEKMDQMFRRRGGPPRHDRPQSWPRDREGRDGPPRGDRPGDGQPPNERVRPPLPGDGDASPPRPERSLPPDAPTAPLD